MLLDSVKQAPVTAVISATLTSFPRTHQFLNFSLALLGSPTLISTPYHLNGPLATDFTLYQSTFKYKTLNRISVHSIYCPIFNDIQDNKSIKVHPEHTELKIKHSAWKKLCLFDSCNWKHCCFPVDGIVIATKALHNSEV